MSDKTALVFKPQSDFPLKPASDQSFNLEQCLNIYKVQKDDSRPTFAVLDGPPYANGHIHLGHVVNKIQKDILNQFNYMNGFNIIYVPGSDCHGLPIEKNIEKELKEEAKDPNFDIKKVDSLVIRSKCRSFADKWIEVQNQEFARLGVFAAWDNHFKTMDHALSILEQFHNFVRKGFVYKGIRPIMWSIAEQTSMATAEVEYKQHESTAIDIKFKVQHSKVLPKDASIVIWTTTPWTIPANRAIAYKDDIEYAMIELKGEKIVLAKALIEALCNRVGTQEYQLVSTFSGSLLEDTICKHPFSDKGYDFPVPLIQGEHVTESDGTGFVHTAPAHGEEDFALGIKFGLEITDIVGSDGTFQNTPLFSGMSFKKAQTEILKELQPYLLSEHSFSHSYPYSWRSHTPLIYKITPQWYLKLEDLKAQALQFSSRLNWLPESSVSRFNGMLLSRGDWCISRQRAWGTPLALFTKDEQAIFDTQVLEQTFNYLTLHGIDAWYTDTAKQILGPIADKYDGVEKSMDTLDVWFDAGCMQYCLLKSQNQEHQLTPYPVDFYLEGSDQHRGFFQACLVINHDSLPVKNILTHGFILDAKGRKMSKSLGNVVSPQDVIKDYGVDVLRLWVALTDCTDDIKYSKQQMDKTKIIYERFRNTIRYLLGCLKGFEVPKTLAAKDVLEQAVYNKMLSLWSLAKGRTGSYREFYNALYHFCDEDLSSFYFDINKDVIYCDSLDSSKRQNILNTYYVIVTLLLKWLAPVLKHTCQEAWMHFKQETVVKNATEHSIFTQRFDTLDDPISESVALWEKCKRIRGLANEKIELLRAEKIINQTLEARLEITSLDDLSPELLQYLTMTGKVVVKKGDLNVQAFNMEGTRCQRCRRYFEGIIELCTRCEQVATG